MIFFEIFWNAKQEDATGISEMKAKQVELMPGQTPEVFPNSLV